MGEGSSARKLNISAMLSPLRALIQAGIAVAAPRPAAAQLPKDEVVLGRTPATESWDFPVTGQQGELNPGSSVMGETPQAVQLGAVRLRKRVS